MKVTTPSGDATGTAFAIRSKPDSTVYLTAAHVLGCTSDGTGCASDVKLFLNGNFLTAHPARVLSHGSIDTSDFALIELPEGPFPTAGIANVAPSVGDALASLGYPGDDVTRAEHAALTETNLDVAFTFGKIASFETDGIFEYSGIAYVGDSGGPIFNPQTGDVFGVVHGQSQKDFRYQGFGPVALHTFLKTNERFVAGYSPESVVTRADCSVEKELRAEIRCYKSRADAGDARAAYVASALIISSTPQDATSAGTESARATESLYYLRAAANAHDIPAEWHLGIVLGLGAAPFQPTDKDPNAGADWQNRAYVDALVGAKAGNLEDQAYEGAMLLSITMMRFSDSASKGVAVLTDCASHGNGECAFRLGYHELFVPDQGPKIANQWFQKAANEGYKPAMFELARSYETGRGETVDRDKASELYRTALPINASDVLNLELEF